MRLALMTRLPAVDMKPCAEALCGSIAEVACHCNLPAEVACAVRSNVKQISSASFTSSRLETVSTEMQWNRLVVNLWSKMSLFCSMKEGVSYLFLSATTYLLFCHVQPPPRSAVPHVCCRPSNGRKMQALTAVEWLTAVRYETDGRLANGWTDGLPENRLT